MNPNSSPYPAPMPDEKDDPIARVYEVLRELDSNSAKWTLGITLLGGVLKQQDEFTQRRLLAGVPSELRAAIYGITEIQAGRVSPNAPERLQ